MIMTMLKQSTRYYLDEKEYEVASTYAELYGKIIIQYSNNRNQAIAALRDLAYEFLIIGHHRSSKKYYNDIQKHFGSKALSDYDLVHLAEAEEKLGHLDKAMSGYQSLVRRFPRSRYVKSSYDQMSRICTLCGNRNKAIWFHELSLQISKSGPLKKTPRKAKKVNSKLY